MSNANDTTTTTTTPVVFFDTHGSWWVTCSPDFPGAVAFGPSGSAFPLSCEGLPAGITAWELARRAGNLVRAEDEFGFDTLRAS